MEIIILRKEADLGFAAEQELRTILRKDIETRKDINKFRGEARKFLVTMLKKLFSKNPGLSHCKECISFRSNVTALIFAR